MSENIFQELSEAIQSFNPDLGIKIAKKALELGIDPIKGIDEGLSKGIRIIGDRFEKGELFITHLAMAAETMKVALEIFQPELDRSKIKRKKLGTIILGTVEGDIHDIGKMLVGTMLTASGFEVIDLGVDVPIQKFIEEAKKHNADAIATSALLTTTRMKNIELIESLKKAGLDEKIKLIVGGAVINEKWAKEIGANLYAENAVEAPKVLEKALRLKAET